jgi:hypothetical protein
MSVKKTVIYWRDIPSQVIVQRGRQREKAQLSARFQEAIDRAAMRAGKGSSDAYLNEWRRVTESLDSVDDLANFVRSEVARLESEYSDERLLSMIRNNGAD